MHLPANMSAKRFPDEYAFVPMENQEAYVELTLIERANLACTYLGLYMFPLAASSQNQMERTDVHCAMDNSRVPTHKLKAE